MEFCGPADFSSRTRRRFLYLKSLALVARAHALVAGLAAVAIGAGLHLDAGKRAAILVAAMIAAALYAAANALVGLLVVHE